MHDDSSGGDEKPKRQGSYVGDKYMPLSSTPVRERGGCLTAFLLFVIAVNAFFLYAIWNQYNDIADYNWLYRDPGMAQTVLLCAGMIQAFVLACAIALWNWKKWGYQGVTAAYFLNFILNLVFGNLVVAIGAIIHLIILWYLVSSREHLLE